jgi:hypothetical protein
MKWSKLWRQWLMARARNILAAAYSGGFGVASEEANGGDDMVLPPGRADS